MGGGEVGSDCDYGRDDDDGGDDDADDWDVNHWSVSWFDGVSADHPLTKTTKAWDDGRAENMAEGPEGRTKSQPDDG